MIDVGANWNKLTISMDMEDIPSQVLIYIFQYVTERADVLISREDATKIDAWLKNRPIRTKQ